ncbi:MAG TPA: hypothetical protein P5267_00935 [Patescibacteria group bacterium]|nr:hypothetical protein [Patescibacteria group bacterium]
MIAAKQGISKKKLIIYLSIIALMIVTNVFVYLKNSHDGQVAENEIIALENLTSPNNNPNQVGPKNQSALEHRLFNTLKKIGDWPITPQNIGKADPFAPFFSSP